MKIVFLTGFSGSGKSTALRNLEGLGYYCVDNLPAPFLLEFIALIEKEAQVDKVGIVLDARSRGLSSDLEGDLDKLRKQHDLKIVYFETDLDVITRRYKSSRMKHPLALNGTIEQGYSIEQKWLAPLRQRADKVINTSSLNVHAQKSVFLKYLDVRSHSRFEIQLTSFGYKYGLPQEADVVIDVRFLANPFFEPKLREKTGKTKPVQQYILDAKETKPFLNKTKSYLSYLVKQYIGEGKVSINLAFGCTGGKHRSVFLAETMAKEFKELGHEKVAIHHRDVSLD